MKDASDDSAPPPKPPEIPLNVQTTTEPKTQEKINPDMPQFKLRFLLSGHKRAVSCLKFSPDGTYLASSCTSRLFPDLAASYN
jgi:COMPASS component SWD3